MTGVQTCALPIYVHYITNCPNILSMIMTPAILAPIRPIFSRQARTGTRQYRNRIDHKFRYERPKKEKIVRRVDGKTASYGQPIYNAILGNFDRALTDITWARVVTTAQMNDCPFVNSAVVATRAHVTSVRARSKLPRLAL